METKDQPDLKPETKVENTDSNMKTTKNEVPNTETVPAQPDQFAEKSTGDTKKPAANKDIDELSAEAPKSLKKPKAKTASETKPKKTVKKADTKAKKASDESAPEPEVKKKKTTASREKIETTTGEKKAKKESAEAVSEPEEKPAEATVHESMEEKLPDVAVEEKQESANTEIIVISEPEHRHEDSSEVLGADSDDSDDDEDDDSDEEENAEEIINYDGLSRLELVEMLEPLVAESNINIIKKKVSLIKVAFHRLNKEAQEKRFEDYLSQGGEEEDFVPTEDKLEERYNAAFSIYSHNRKKWLDEQEKIKQDNLETKKLILEELKTLIESEESLKKTYDEFRELQDRWKQIGMVPKSEVNNLWQSYHFYVERFFDKVKINKELRDLDMKKNMEAKIELCEKAEELLLENSILKSFKKLQDYHRLWKEVGPVPQDKKDELWERFKSTSDSINQRRRDHYNSLRDNQKNNYIAKSALCDKAEEILQFENESIKDWQVNTDKISELLKVWKTIGPAPRADNDAIWDKFKTSLDAFFEGKKDFFQKIKDEQLNNYNLKLDLCTQAEAIKTSTDWRNTTNDLIKFQKEWKEIGPVPKKHSDRIWKRFRAACDEFFEAKANYFSNIKQHESDNLAKKEELINQVETFEFAGNKNKDLEVLKNFQREWTDIGHVPFKEKDRLQTAFRNAINKQMEKLKISKFEMQKIDFKQRFEKIHDKPNANRIINNERTFLLNKRKALEDEVNLWENNMGFLAESKNASLLKIEFEKKIEKQKVEIELINDKIRFLERETE